MHLLLFALFPILMLFDPRVALVSLAGAIVLLYRARQTKDGLDCYSQGIHNLANTPIEMIELAYPLRVNGWPFGLLYADTDRPEACLRRSRLIDIKALRDQERQIAEQAEKSYEQFVARWKTRPPRNGVRERLNPARLE